MKCAQCHDTNPLARMHRYTGSGDWPCHTTHTHGNRKVEACPCTWYCAAHHVTARHVLKVLLQRTVTELRLLTPPGSAPQGYALLGRRHYSAQSCHASKRTSAPSRPAHRAWGAAPPCPTCWSPAHRPCRGDCGRRWPSPVPTSRENAGRRPARLRGWQRSSCGRLGLARRPGRPCWPCGRRGTPQTARHGGW